MNVNRDQLQINMSNIFIIVLFVIVILNAGENVEFFPNEMNIVYVSFTRIKYS